MVDMKERIARRVAKELNDGDVVNLGIGLPTMVAECLPGGGRYNPPVRKRYNGHGQRTHCA